MDILGFVREIVETVSDNIEIKEMLKTAEVKIVMVWKNGAENALTGIIKKGEISVESGKCDNPDFQLEISKKDFISLITSKTSGWVLIATRRMVLTKGKWLEFTKYIKPLGLMPRVAMKIKAERKARQGRMDSKSPYQPTLH